MNEEKEHPVDKINRLDSELAAAEHGEYILSNKENLLKSLILTYNDEDAHAKLDVLREWFWGHALPLNRESLKP